MSTKSNFKSNLERFKKQVRINTEATLKDACYPRADQIVREANKSKPHGRKDDAGKQRWYAMPLCVLNDLADTFNHGSEEYGLFNCLQEFENPKQRWWNALMRHLEECQIDPLAKDEKSGCYHAACVAFNALMYLYHCKRGSK